MQLSHTNMLTNYNCQHVEQIGKLRRIFVYGSLKKGFRLYDIYLKDKHFAGIGRIAGYLFKLNSNFPALILERNGTIVEGELYDVLEADIRTLDGVEGCPGFYKRVAVNLMDGQTVWTYVINERSRNADWPVIPSGKWEGEKTYASVEKFPKWLELVNKDKNPRQFMAPRTMHDSCWDHNLEVPVILMNGQYPQLPRNMGPGISTPVAVMVPPKPYWPGISNKIHWFGSKEKLERTDTKPEVYGV